MLQSFETGFMRLSAAAMQAMRRRAKSDKGEQRQRSFQFFLLWFVRDRIAGHWRTVRGRCLGFGGDTRREEVKGALAALLMAEAREALREGSLYAAAPPHFSALGAVV